MRKRSVEIARSSRAVTVDGWSGSEPQHNLPAQPTPLIGRESKLREAHKQLLQDDVRLLTLTGPGGSGKTRLALAVAEGLSGAFANGVWLVDLTPLREPSLVLPTIAKALGLQGSGRRPIVETLFEHLRDRQILLLLDNCEHVLDAVPQIAELLGACRQLKMLAASREPLRLRWEHELPVPPLLVPDLQNLPDPATLGAVPSVELFVERAQAAVPSFTLTEENASAVAEICVRLDGLPLALELAAARTRVLPIQAMLRRLEHDLSILTSEARDRPARHRTLSEAIGWSYDLLDEDERALFRRLSIFVGSFTLGAVEAVARDEGRRDEVEGRGGMTRPSPLDLVASLVDKSLLRCDSAQGGETRFRMLETIREFAHEQLQAGGELNQAARRHAEYFLALAERAEPELIGPHQEVWLNHLDRERDNLRAAQRWAVSQGDAEMIERLVAALSQFWRARADAADAREWINAMVPLARMAPPTPALARALHGAGLLAGALADYPTCRSLLEESLAVARQLEDCRTLATALDSLGREAFVEGRYPEARVLLNESLVLLRDLGDRHGLAQALSHLGFLEYLEGHQGVARALYREGLELARQADDPNAIAEYLDNLGRTLHVEGDLDGAVRAYEQAEAICRELGQAQRLAMVLNNLGSAHTLRGDVGVARAQLLEALSIGQRNGNRRRLAFILAAVAALAAIEGEAERAVRFAAVASAAVAEIGASLSQPINAAGARLVQRARRALAVAATESAEAAARTLTLADAVDDAMVWLAAPNPVAQPGPGPDRPKVLRSSVRSCTEVADPKPATRGALTPREREVAALIARGYSNRQIAAALVISPHTAERHVERILDRLNLSSRAGIAAWEARHGLASDAVTSTASALQPAG